MNKMSFVGHDRKIATAIVNQGIDARLEGFTGSKFSDDGHRLSCKIAADEMQIFVRRLNEHVEANPEDENADLLLDDVVQVFYHDEE